MNTNAQALEKQNQRDIEEVERAKANLKKTVADGIKAAYDQTAALQEEGLPANVMSELHLSDTTLRRSLWKDL
jgi:hypothetical protein